MELAYTKDEEKSLRELLEALKLLPSNPSKAEKELVHYLIQETKRKVLEKIAKTDARLTEALSKIEEYEKMKNRGPTHHTWAAKNLRKVQQEVFLICNEIDKQSQIPPDLIRTDQSGNDDGESWKKSK